MTISISNWKLIKKWVAGIEAGLRITLLTVIFSLFMHQGWYQPTLLHAATVTLYPTANTTTGTVTSPANVYANDTAAASISSATASETANTFNSTNMGTITDVTVWVKYKTSAAPNNDTYQFDAAVDGTTFNQSIVASNIINQTAYTTASKSLGALTWAQVGTLAVKCTTAKVGQADVYTVDWDVAYIVVTYAAKTDQTITVGTPAPASAAYNSQFTVAATASSSLAVTYSSGTPAICTNSGATFTMVSGTGTCTVQYNQAGDATYNAAPQVTNSVTATLATQAAVTVSAPASAYYGQTGLSATAAGGSGTGAYSYSAGSSTACTVNASTGALTITSGTGTCNITATRAADTNYNVSAASAAASVTISKATPVLTVSNSPVTYDGTAKSATVNGSVAGTVSSILTGGLASQTNAGTYAVTANFTPTDTVNYNSLTAANAGNFVINPAAPTASITNSPVTYSGSLQTATVACTGGGTATIATGGTGTNAGSYPTTVNCAASTNYSAASALSAGNFVINPATPTASVTNSPVTYDGTAKSATATCSGGGVVSNILTGGVASQTSAGTYAVTADCAASANYTAGTGIAAGNFVIAKATPVLSVSNSPVTYDGTAKSATVNGSVAGTVSSILTGGLASQTNAGTYAVTASFTPTDTVNYNSLTAANAGNFVINPAAPTASITNSPVTYNGLAQTATVACTGGGTATIATGGTGTNAGSYPTTVNCAASADYSAASGLSAGNFVINKANQVITFGALASKVYGDPAFTLSATGGASVNPVTFASSNLTVATISGTTVTIVGAGITTITASQAGDANYNAASDVFQALTIDKANQTITFAALPAKTVGDPDFAPGATASSTLTVTYASSNIAVATIVSGQIHIVGAGTANITASQSGNANYNAALDVIQPLTVNAASNPTLNVTISGNGSVNSSPAGISCTTGTCSATFTSGQSVSLAATTSWNYNFSGWSGACTGTLTPCTVVVSSPTNVTATFSAKQLVKIGTSFYPSMQEAYNAALEGAVLQGRNDILLENLNFNRAVNVTFNGGNDATWAVVGFTTISGSVTLTSGSVDIRNMIIQ